MSKWLERFKGEKVAKEFDIGFVAETPSEQYEAACQQVANLLDLHEWQWLKQRIHDEKLSMPAIMDLVAEHI